MGDSLIKSARQRPALVGLLLVVMLHAWSADAQPADPATTPNPGTTEPAATNYPPIQSLLELSPTNLDLSLLQTAVTQVQAEAAMEGPIKLRILQSLTNSMGVLSNRFDFFKKTQTNQQAISSITNLTEKVRGEIASLATNKTTLSLTNQEVSTLSQIQAQAEADLEAAKKVLADLQEEPKRRTTRKEEIPKRIAAAKSRLEEIQLALAATPPANQPPPITQVDQLSHLANQALLLQEIQSLESQLKADEATADLLSLQTERQATRVSHLTKRVAEIRETLASARKRESELAAKKAASARSEFSSADPRVNELLADISAQVANLASNQVTVAESLQQASHELSQTEERLTTLVADYSSVRQRVQASEAAGVRIADSIGVLLRKHSRGLPDTRALRNRLRQRLRAITDAQVQELVYQDEKEALIDLDGYLEKELKALDPSRSLSDWDARDIQQAQEALRSKRKYLEDVIRNYRELGETLLQLSRTENQLKSQATEFRQFIEERVLWVRSADRIGLPNLLEELNALTELLKPDNWQALAVALRKSILSGNPTNALALLGFLVSLILQRWARRQVVLQADQAADRNQASILPTLKALGATFMVALPLSLSLLAFSLLVRNADPTEPFLFALSEACLAAAVISLTLSLFRQFFRKRGLAKDHFGWLDHNISLFRLHLRWLFPMTIGLVFVVAFLERLEVDANRARLSFIGLTVVVALFFYRILHPAKGWVPAQKTLPGFRRLTLLAGAGLPFGLAVTSAVGYHYTALMLAWQLLDTVWLILAIVLLRSIILRWFYLERRALALEKLRRKREAAAEKDKDSAETKAAENEVAQISITQIKEQTQSLLKMVVMLSLIGGLWWIWQDTLPALNILEKKTVWYIEVNAPQAGTQDSSTPAGMLPGMPRLGPAAIKESSGATAQSPAEAEQDLARAPRAGSKPGTILQPITLWDITLAGVAIALTLMAGRNLPGFLEITLFKYFTLEPGSGYAIKALVRYAVSLIGVIAACGFIGLSWEKVQWLAAAITLGIGFGLQEVFANFVSGLIILFERPIRKDDVVTVGDISGRVSRIRIRATTITSWDNKELIVPNKEFITNRLVNWTLSDSVIRHAVNVGIAYGSDVELATRILLRIADEHPNLLKDPCPKVVFESFGASSLNLLLYVFVPDLTNLLLTKHQLNLAIDREFKKAGIEIAFNQLDTHIKTLPASVQAFLQEHRPVRKTDPAEPQERG